MIPPDMVGKIREIPDDEYGWDHFRLVSEEQKIRYLAAQFICQFVDSAEDRDLIVSHFEKYVPGLFDNCDLVGEERSYESGGKTYTYIDRSYPTVDHQSAFCLSKVDQQMLDSMTNFFMDPRVVVLGGNDNTDSHSNVVDGATEIPFFSALMTDGTKVRLKTEGPYWVMFGRNGTKARISLDPNVPDYTKSLTPELVDVKITDYCGKGCKFCYQSSTKDGKHASYEDIVKIFDMLAEMEVFEVALGGGEPTDHPDFIKILAAAGERGIVPNFTTLSDRWLNDPDVIDAVNKYVGGIGVSCSDHKALALRSQIRKAVSWHVVVSAQHVLGAVPLTVTAKFLDEAFGKHIPVLLLGFKEVGFGAQYNRHDDSSTEVVLKLAIDQAKENCYPQLSVDTALINQYPQLLDALGVPDALITSPEGKFSCYIDAVSMQMGPSSYVEQNEMEILPETVDAFKTNYARY